METVNNNSNTETSKEQKPLPKNKLLLILWFILDWRILIGLCILYYSIFGGSTGEIMPDAWTGNPIGYYSPPLSIGSRIVGISFAAPFILGGIFYRIMKVKERSKK